MNFLTLSANYLTNKVEMRQDLIVGLQSLDEAYETSNNKTRVFFKGGTFKDVLEQISEIRAMLVY